MGPYISEKSVPKGHLLKGPLGTNLGKTVTGSQR